jgi:hypothetical protein
MENLGKHLQGGLAFTENDVASHATDIFRPIAQEVSMVDSTLIYVKIDAPGGRGPYNFPITPKGDQYIQMNQMRLWIQGSVLLADGTKAVAADGIGVINLMANSLFKTMELEVGGKLIPDLQSTHANFKAYLETLLSYGEEARGSHLQASGFSLDAPKAYDDVKHGTTTKEAPNANTANTGLIARRGLVAASRTFDFMIPLHYDFFNCDRLLPPGIEMTLKLTREDDNFVLLNKDASKQYEIILSKLILCVPYITIAPDIVAQHKIWIKSGPIVLPIKKTEVTVFHRPAGIVNVSLSSLLMNRVPKTLIIGMVATPSYNGSQTTNPYRFQHFNVNHVCIKHNGASIPSEPYMPDWTNKLYMREYRAFFDNTGVGTDNLGSAITPEQYADGSTLFAFDLTPDKCNGFHWHKRAEGKMVLSSNNHFHNFDSYF